MRECVTVIQLKAILCNDTVFSLQSNDNLKLISDAVVSGRSRVESHRGYKSDTEC